MPSLPPVSGVAKMQLIYTLGEDVNVRNGSFWRWTGQSTQANWTTLAGDIGTKWQTTLATVLSSQLQLTGVDLQDLSAEGAPGVELDVGPFPGAGVGPSEPANVCFLMKFALARRYRGGKPRWYQPGMETASRFDAQTWEPSTVTAMETQFADFFVGITTITTAGVQLQQQVNVSYYQGFKPFEEPSGRYRNISQLRVTPLVDTITAQTGSKYIASQRRRTMIGQ